MKKYLVAVILAVAPAAVSAHILNNADDTMSAANAAIENGDLTGGHRLASEVMDGVKDKGGKHDAVTSINENNDSKLVTAPKVISKTMVSTVPNINKGEMDSVKSKLGSSKKNNADLSGEIIRAVFTVALLLLLVIGVFGGM